MTAEKVAAVGRSITAEPGGNGLCTGARGARACVSTVPSMAQPIRILGIDPGLRRTGWGLIGCEGNRLIYLACGSVETNDEAALAERLVTIHDGLARVVDEFRARRGGGGGDLRQPRRGRRR